MSPTDRTPIALVTGGSRGLGRATAVALATAGVDVVLTYRSSAAEADAVVAEVEALGRRATALPLDTTDVAGFGAFVDALRPALPDDVFDILVNNAGTALYSALEATTEADFDQIFAVHVKGPVLPHAGAPAADRRRRAHRQRQLRPHPHVLPRVRPVRRRQGRRRGPHPLPGRWSFGARGITANVVAPGAVPTDFGDGHLRSDTALQKMMIDNTALGRLATAEDIGMLIAGLTTASGSWVTGQRIEASGGVRL